LHVLLDGHLFLDLLLFGHELILFGVEVLRDLCPVLVNRALLLLLLLLDELLDVLEGLVVVARLLIRLVVLLLHQLVQQRLLLLEVRGKRMRMVRQVRLYRGQRRVRFLVRRQSFQGLGQTLLLAFFLQKVLDVCRYRLGKFL
jgi:hypothetical protein